MPHIYLPESLSLRRFLSSRHLTINHVVYITSNVISQTAAILFLSTLHESEQYFPISQPINTFNKLIIKVILKHLEKVLLNLIKLIKLLLNYYHLLIIFS